MCSWRLVYRNSNSRRRFLFPELYLQEIPGNWRCLTRISKSLLVRIGIQQTYPTQTHTHVHTHDIDTDTHISTHIHVHNIKTKSKDTYFVCVKQKFSSHVIECENWAFCPLKHVLCRHWAWRKEKWKQFSSLKKLRYNLHISFRCCYIII